MTCAVCSQSLVSCACCRDNKPLSAARMVEIARLALTFGRTERITRHEDGARPETDTDHTVMLSWIACDVAQKLGCFNVGKVAQYALVHDLLEAYTGDFQTLTIDATGRAEKDAAEAKALIEHTDRFGTGTWLVETGKAYEALADPEAVLVKVLDKMMPRLVAVLNGGATLAEYGLDPEGLARFNTDQFTRLAAQWLTKSTCLWAMPTVFDLLYAVGDLAVVAYRERLAKDNADRFGVLLEAVRNA